MSKSRTDTGVDANVTASHSEVRARHIPSDESDATAKRIEELVGDDSVAAFARRCGFGESLLRKYLAGAQPNTQNLVAMANAGSVTVDWLATGRLPKTRAELRVLQASIQPGAITGALLGDALRTGKPFSIEQQRALGVDDDTFCAYLSGARLPTPDFIMRFAEMTGCAIGPLLAAYDVSKAQDNLDKLENQLASPGETELLNTYRNANDTEKTALNRVASAIRTQTMAAWFAAGMAVSDAANIFDKKK